jgi:hypothetical protein
VLVTVCLGGWLILASLCFFSRELFGDFEVFLLFCVLMPVLVVAVLLFLIFSWVTSIKLISEKRFRWALATPLVLAVLLLFLSFLFCRILSRWVVVIDLSLRIKDVFNGPLLPCRAAFCETRFHPISS